MKYFIDTEFIEAGPGVSIDLLSIGIVAEDGREFYAESASANLAMANNWVQEKVLPHLHGPKILLGPMGEAIKRFIADDKPEFWGYYADYDWVVFCQIFGSMMDLPKGWPMYCRDIKQLCDSLGNPKLPEQTSTEHNALNDARWNKTAYEFLTAAPSLLDECLEMRAYIESLPANWNVDSSLEIWFPFTAKDLAALQAERDQLRRQVELDKARLKICLGRFQGCEGGANQCHPVSLAEIPAWIKEIETLLRDRASLSESGS